jgi:signal transduction histidine kinase
VVRIKDTGVGIEEQHLSELFTPFFTTKPVGQGTGLGLSISYSILQQHHAKVTVKSEVGKGTEFALSFVTVSSN